MSDKEEGCSIFNLEIIISGLLILQALTDCFSLSLHPARV